MQLLGARACETTPEFGRRDQLAWPPFGQVVRTRLGRAL